MKYLKYPMGPYTPKPKTHVPHVIFGIIFALTIVWTIGAEWPEKAYAANFEDSGPLTFECSKNCWSYDPAEIIEAMPDGKGVAEPHGVISGYDIRSYATDPKHEARVKAIHEAMPSMETAEDVDAYIRARVRTSPVEGQMVISASEKYRVDVRMGMAIMQQDSSFGTAGVGARTRNPGNIANYDDGSTFTYQTWQAGVDGVYRWLGKHLE